MTFKANSYQDFINRLTTICELYGVQLPLTINHQVLSDGYIIQLTDEFVEKLRKINPLIIEKLQNLSESL